MALLINPYRFSSSFNPVSLFENGTYHGWWVDPTDLSNFKQDAAGTTAVASDGDPVGYVKDKTGRDASAAFIRPTDDTTRPLYKVVSGYSCLRFDGSNDSLDGNENLRDSHKTQQYMTYCFALQADATISYPSNIFVEYLNNYHYIIPRVYSSSTYRCSAFNDPAPSANGTVTNKNILTITVRGDEVSPMVSLRVNGVTTDYNLASETQAWNNARAFEMRLGAGAFKGDIYQAFAIYGKLLSSQEYSDLETALAANAGITL